MQQRIEGESNVKNKIVMPFEDFVTTGSSLINDITIFRSEGAIIHTAMCIGLRDFAALENFEDIDVQLIYFLGPEEIKQFILERKSQQDMRS
jgi:orotate phosphoribosyltransferase